MAEFVDIKVGDEVFQHARFGLGGSIQIVTKVTPTTFHIGSDVFYKTNGSQKGGYGLVRELCSLLTDEKREKVWRDDAVRFLNEFSFNKIKDNAALKTIMTVVESIK